VTSKVGAFGHRPWSAAVSAASTAAPPFTGGRAAAQAGLTLLRDARHGAESDPVAAATASSFICLGSG